MKQVTRNIDPSRAQDLLERVPRACICFASDQGPQAQPIIMLWREGRYLAGIPRDAGRQPVPGQEVVLLIDEGIYYFDLRAIYIRGQVQPTEAPRGSACWRHMARGGATQNGRLGLRNAPRGDR